MTIRVRVKKNNFGAIARALPDAIDEEVKEAAEDITERLKGILWIDTGTLRRVTRNHEAGSMHAEVWIGYYLGTGFYSGFQEFGTFKQAARPIVGPTAHEYEMVYAHNMERAVRKACEAKA